MNRTIAFLEGRGGIKHPGHLLIMIYLNKVKSLNLRSTSNSPFLSFPTSQNTAYLEIVESQNLCPVTSIRIFQIIRIKTKYSFFNMLLQILKLNFDFLHLNLLQHFVRMGFLDRFETLGELLHTCSKLSDQFYLQICFMDSDRSAIITTFGCYHQQGLAFIGNVIVIDSNEEILIQYQGKVIRLPIIHGEK